MAGANLLEAPAPPSVIRLSIEAVGTSTNLAMLSAALLTWALRKWEDSLLFAAVVLLSCVASVVGQLGLDEASDALNEGLPAVVQCRRDGVLTELPTAELVPGDVIEVSRGDTLPADVRIVECADLHVLEASLIGEAAPVRKHCLADHAMVSGGLAHCMLYASTCVTEGQAVGLVTATGMSTKIGKVAQGLSKAGGGEGGVFG
eukprot:CAMPEP_0198605120 /NCGR_PEP_ID=MMETSP1462-20131121/154071_1 /TAXON_ID=1333877 /ORGANISM="Brandtodinium nutriculum, Strain RCC3387" /LENGTH=202 /DNA_ID=CAMNT_0044336915 /DNA_START=16 /DNA_END=620 /DNA_ORIENTATION=+